MRFVIYGIFLTLWMGMWVWTYTCHIKGTCCQARTSSPNSENVMLTFDEPPVFSMTQDTGQVLASEYVLCKDRIVLERFNHTPYHRGEIATH